MKPIRTERVVLSQLQNWAETRDNIRAVMLTSSRAHPHRTPDVLSDYDVEVYVRDMEPMARDDSWLAEFGSIMVRWPLRPCPTFSDEWITQLVLFDDGVRIDFQITARARIDSPDLDSGYRVLVDKDGLASHLPPPSYSRYGVARPSADEFDDRLNAFWWDIVYVAKGLWRGELNYAKYMLDGTIRFDKLQPLLAWYIGTLHGWSVEVGIHGRWFHRYLDQPTWEHYRRTFAGASTEDNWTALFETLELVRAVGKHVAEALGFDYPGDVDAKVTRFIREIRALERYGDNTQ